MVVLEVIFALFLYWLYYIVPAAFISTPMWFFGRKRMTWLAADYLLLVLPPMFYVVGTVIMDKGGFNPIFELPVLGLSIGLPTFLRILISSRMNEKMFSVSILITWCSAGILIPLLIPATPK